MAKNLWLKGCAAAAVMIFAGAVPLSAQMFEDAAVPTAEENQPAAPRFNNSWANPRRSQAAQPAAKSIGMPDLSVDKTGAQAAQDARKNAAEALSKSLAGKRGYIKTVGIISGQITTLDLGCQRFSDLLKGRTIFYIFIGYAMNSGRFGGNRHTGIYPACLRFFFPIWEDLHVGNLYDTVLYDIYTRGL